MNSPLMIYLPEIAERDYACFARLRGNDFRGSYAEWIELGQKQQELHQSDIVVRVPVTLAGFEAFCRDGELPHDKSRLYAYAREIGEKLP